MTKKEFIALYAEKANFETKVDAEKKLDTVLNLFEDPHCQVNCNFSPQ